MHSVCTGEPCGPGSCCGALRRMKSYRISSVVAHTEAPHRTLYTSSASAETTSSLGRADVACTRAAQQLPRHALASQHLTCSSSRGKHTTLATSSADGWIRTSDLRVTKPMHYPSCATSALHLSARDLNPDDQSQSLASCHWMSAHSGSRCRTESIRVQGPDALRGRRYKRVAGIGPALPVWKTGRSP